MAEYHLHLMTVSNADGGVGGVLVAHGWPRCGWWPPLSGLVLRRPLQSDPSCCGCRKPTACTPGDLAGFDVCYLTALVITARILRTTAVNDWSR
jgi:hypothetical protein